MSTKREVWELCQHDETLAQLVRDAGIEGGPFAGDKPNPGLDGIEVTVEGKTARWERFVGVLRESGGL